MFPREHGAYGQLLFPLIAALAIGRPGWAAFFWAAAAVCAFLAHEPLLVLMGQRGSRAAREERQTARRWLVAYALAGAACAAPAWWLMAPAARTAVMVPAALALIFAGVLAAGREHTAAGEAFSAVVMASLAWPAALAAGALPIAARTCAAVFGASFAAGTLAVHAVIARTRRPPAVLPRALAVAAASMVPGLLWYLSRLGVLDAMAPIAALPMSIAAAFTAAIAPPARRLRYVGWALVMASVGTMATLIVVLRPR
jgi:hypothetical protein